MRLAHPHPHRPAGHRRGIALIIVMLMVLAMGIAAGILAYSMKVETKLATNTSASGELGWLGLSGVEFAKWVLAEQQRIPGEQGYNGLNQFWAGGPGGNGNRIGDLMENPFEGISLKDITVGEGHLSIEIVDQERKLDINRADPIALEAGLAMAGAGASEAAQINAALTDWRDRDDHPTAGGGAESTDFYLNLDPPYRAKNGPIDDIGELLKVRGITPDLFFGQPTAHGPARGIDRLRHDDVGSVPAGLVDLFCAISAGQININTASLPVLTMAFRGDRIMARQIVQARSGPDGADGTADDEPARNPGDINRLMGPVAAPGRAAPPLPRFITISTTFEVRIEAAYGRAKRHYVALIQRRSARDFQTLVFREN